MNTTRNNLSALALLTVAVLGVGCSSSGGEATAASGADGGDSASVTIDDMSFQPADATVDAGTTIQWVNDDDVMHTVSFDDDAVEDSGEMSSGDEFSTTFDEAGEYAYVCALHPDMTGTVTVR